MRREKKTIKSMYLSRKNKNGKVIMELTNEELRLLHAIIGRSDYYLIHHILNKPDIECDDIDIEKTLNGIYTKICDALEQ